ncbi:MAG TPA: hypothetical protein VHM92_04200 [Allosphingosinicella sp.]|nr:hypothetical protein [Allosphingosinicella sp.]
MIGESELDALLQEALAPPDRPADRGFVARLDRVVAEAERYRAARALLLRQLASEGLAAGAIAGSLFMLAQIPGLRAAIGAAPGLGWTALLALFLFWLLIRGRSAALA